MMDMSKRVGQFVGVSADKVRTFPNGRSFRFVVYGALDAYGLIGPEKNGVAVLDEDSPSVVCDELARADSGYFGPSREQLELFQRMTSEDFGYEDLVALVNASPRARYQLSA